MIVHADRPRILMVDDHDENLLALEAVLDEPNYELVRANSGRGALRAALQTEFAVILLDVAMPDMDGYETAALLRERDSSRHTPIIFLTANYRSERHVFRGYSVGAVDYLTKPFSPEVLKSKVAVFVELYESRRAVHRHADALQRAHDELEQRVRERTAELAEATARERELRAHAEQINRLKDEFLATLSHELRTPLNAVVGWIHLLEMPGSDPVLTARALSGIKTNALAQSQIIEDILDVSRIISGKLRLRVTPVSIAQVVEAAIDAILPAATAKNITVNRHIDVGEPVMIDRDRIQQVCWNVLANAVKFTLKGGVVDIRVHQEGDEIVLTFTDSGVGIAPEFLPYIFDRFRQEDSSATRRHGGLGLGMAIVRHLVELHGGTVRAESPGLGQGARFTIVLPRRVASAEERDDPAITNDRTRPALQSHQPLAGQRVLLTCDDAETCARISTHLREAGAAVLVAGDPEAAQSVLQREDITLLVSDVDMPGIGVVSRVRDAGAARRGGELPAIAFSGHPRTNDSDVALHGGYDLYLSKPIAPSELVQAIETLTTIKQHP